MNQSEIHFFTPSQHLEGVTSFSYKEKRATGAKQSIVILPPYFNIASFDVDYFFRSIAKENHTGSVLCIQAFPTLEIKDKMVIDAALYFNYANQGIISLVEQLGYEQAQSTYLISNVGNLITEWPFETDNYYVSGPVIRTPWSIAVNTSLKLILESTEYNAEAKSNLNQAVKTLFLTSYHNRNITIDSLSPSVWQLILSLEATTTEHNFIPLANATFLLSESDQLLEQEFFLQYPSSKLKTIPTLKGHLFMQ